MSDTSPDRNLLSTIGLCARARGLILGTPMVCEAMRKKQGVLTVLEASDTSENTHDKLVSKCAYYKIPLYRIPATTIELGRAIGKAGAVAAVGITNSGLLKALEKHLHAACTQEVAQDDCD